MAGVEKHSASSDNRKIKKTCGHSKKDVVSDVQCDSANFTFTQRV